MPALTTIMLTTPVVNMKTAAAHTLVPNTFAASARVYPLRAGIVYTNLVSLGSAPVVAFFGSWAGGGADIVTGIAAGSGSSIAYELLEVPLGDSGGNRYVMQPNAGPISFSVDSGATGTTVEGFAWMLAVVTP